MAKYLQRGSNWLVSSDADADYRDSLPPGNYVVKFSPKGYYYLEESARFVVGRIYGDTAKVAARVLRTYMDRGCNTGVLAIGEKGTGKTLLTRLVANLAAADHDIPTIMVNEKYTGDEFSTFLAGVEQRTVVLFDEFEKVYDVDEQEGLLTLLDGVYQMNKLFLLTANDEWKVNNCMISRPGRIFYYLQFGPIDRAFVVEYCNENLDNKDLTPAVCDVAKVYGNFSFDVLKALIEEMNRYGESPSDTLKYLNVRMNRFEYDQQHELTVEHDGAKIDDARIDDRHWRINPATTRFMIEISSEDETDDEPTKLRINPGKIVDIRDGGRFIHYRDQGYDIFANADVPKPFDPLTSLAIGYESVA